MIKHLECSFYCNGCKKEEIHCLVYINDVLVSSECKNCGRQVHFSEQTLMTYFAKDIVQRILTKPQRLSEELKKDLHKAILTLPSRIISKPYRLVEEMHEVVEEESKNRRKK
jgi:hypothetical protein